MAVLALNGAIENDARCTLQIPTAPGLPLGSRPCIRRRIEQVILQHAARTTQPPSSSAGWKYEHGGVCTGTLPGCLAAPSSMVVWLSAAGA
jgi:hypothetical protein